MAQPQFIVEGGRRLSGTIRPAGNKNAALPILCAALLTDQPVTLENVPHIKDILSLVELIKQAGATAEWTAPNTLVITANAVRGTRSIPRSVRGFAARSSSPHRCSPGPVRSTSPHRGAT